ncbi:MAG: hypothetical protein ACJ741_12080 [Pyrinomonadaceae bacterium]
MRTALTITRTFLTSMLTFVGGHNICPASSAQNNFDSFDFYGHISWENEKARLDNFANELQHDPKLVGYIIVYAGKHSCVGEAQNHARRAMGYLVKTRHIQQSRLRAIDGGFQEEFGVTLQPWLSSTGEFAPSPTLKPSEVTVSDCKPKSAKRRKRHI